MDFTRNTLVYFRKVFEMSARVLISLPETFLSQIDTLAKEEQRSRSELIREAVRQYASKAKKSKKEIEQ